MPIDEVCPNETACAAKTSFAVYSDTSFSHRNHLVRKIDELSHEGERRARAIIEYHVQVLNSQRREIGGRIELRVESHYQADVPRRKVR